MRPLISGRTVRTIERLRQRGWSTSLATSSPQLQLTVYRDSVVDPIGPYDVVADWPDSASVLEGSAATPGGESAISAIFRRTIQDDFDIEVGDRVAYADLTGEVYHVWQEGGMTKAAVRMDAGTP